MSTVTPLTDDEITRFGIDPDDRRLFVDTTEAGAWLEQVGAAGTVQTHGPCANLDIHAAHVFTSAVYPTHISGWSCPGVYDRCVNCNDRLCMACVMREWHERCEDDCPVCCVPGSERGAFDDDEFAARLAAPRAYSAALYQLVPAG